MTDEMDTATVKIGTEAEMLDMIRARKAELGITNDTIDGIAGLPTGYCAKLLCDPPVKRMGPLSLGLILAALGYTIQLVPDIQAFERARRRMVGRKRALLPIASRPKPKPFFTKKNAAEMGRLGGLKRAANRIRAVMISERNRANILARWQKSGSTALETARRGPSNL